MFLNRAVDKLNRSISPQLTVANIAQLQAYDWPGNIRELENVIERAVILARDGRLVFDLPDAKSGTVNGSTEAATIETGAKPQAITKRADLQQMEAEAILSALEKCAGRVSGAGGAAELLEMKPTTLYSRIKRFGIDIRDYKPSAQ